MWHTMLVVLSREAPVAQDLFWLGCCRAIYMFIDLIGGVHSQEQVACSRP